MRATRSPAFRHRFYGELHGRPACSPPHAYVAASPGQRRSAQPPSSLDAGDCMRRHTSIAVAWLPFAVATACTEPMQPTKALAPREVADTSAANATLFSRFDPDALSGGATT